MNGVLGGSQTSCVTSYKLQYKVGLYVVHQMRCMHFNLASLFYLCIMFDLALCAQTEPLFEPKVIVGHPF